MILSSGQKLKQLLELNFSENELLLCFCVCISSSEIFPWNNKLRFVTFLFNKLRTKMST